MNDPPSRPHAAIRSALATLVMLASCGRDPLRPFSAIQDGAMHSLDLPPIATILGPTPSRAFTAILAPPVAIRWNGQDPDGSVREYRYRLFETKNPDFPGQPNFLEFLAEDPDSVLHFYEPDFQGWTSVRADKDSASLSVTYSDLVPYGRYAFAVVAIDDRGDHDANLSPDRNILQFAVSPTGIEADLTFLGPFGEVTDPDRSVPLVVPGHQAATIRWFGTPPPGRVIEGYHSSIDGFTVGQGSFTLGDTIATVPPPTSGDSRLLFVEVQLDEGVRSLWILPLSFTGSASTAAELTPAGALPCRSMALSTFPQPGHQILGDRRTMSATPVGRPFSP